MLTLLLALILNITNASDILLKDGKYYDHNYGLEVQVLNHEAKSAKLDEIVIPLTKNGGVFSGSITKDEITTIFSVTAKNKKSIYTDVVIERTLPKNFDNQSYSFKDIGIEVTVNNNLIQKITTGNNQDSRTDITLNTDGTIAEYTIQNSKECPYLLKVTDSQVQSFWCNQCKFEIMGIEKSSILIESAAYIKFTPNTVFFYNSSNLGKKITNTYDGTRLDITTYLYDTNKKIVTISNELEVNTDNVKLTNSARFVLKKLL